MRNAVAGPPIGRDGAVKATGERLKIKRLTSRSEGGRWKRAKVPRWRPTLLHVQFRESVGVRFPRATRPYVKVQGRWCYLYRAIDRAGNLIDAMLSETRDLKAAKQFFAHALAVVGPPPQRVTTDGHAAYPRAIREVLGKTVRHRRNPYLNSRLEQDHRGITQRYYLMQGFGNVEAAARFCYVLEEVRYWFRPRQRMKQAVSLAVKRRLFVEQFAVLQTIMLAA